MLFQVVHTHTSETCPGVDQERLPQFAEWWAKMKSTPGVRVLGGYVAPMDHVFYITVEADDYPTLARALGPLNSIGSGRTTPVITLEQAMPMAEAGAFRPA